LSDNNFLKLLSDKLKLLSDKSRIVFLHWNRACFQIRKCNYKSSFILGKPKKKHYKYKHGRYYSSSSSSDDEYVSLFENNPLSYFSHINRWPMPIILKYFDILEKFLDSINES